MYIKVQKESVQKKRTPCMLSVNSWSGGCEKQDAWNLQKFAPTPMSQIKERLQNSLTSPPSSSSLLNHLYTLEQTQKTKLY